jgi:hypothetical protein
VRLHGAPDAATLARLYHELGRLGAPARGDHAAWTYGEPAPEELVVLASQAARYDPRLLWILVQLVALRFERLDPRKLRIALRDSAWPAALGVVFEFARRVQPSPELADTAKFVLSRTPPASGEQFFFASGAFGGEMVRRNAEESLAEYKRWGFFGREEPIAKELGIAARGTLGTTERVNVLRRLARRMGTFTLGDYVDALGGRVSARQASRDLASAPFLVRRGSRRGARYRLRPERLPRALVAGDRVRIFVSGRRLPGKVLQDLGTSGDAGRQLVRVAVRDPVAGSEPLEVTVPSSWLELRDAPARSTSS